MGGAGTLSPPMFSGIIETTSSTLSLLPSSSDELIRFRMARPKSFNDLSLGDSVAVNGVCLTVEAFDEDSIQFAIGKETLQVTGWSQAFVEKAQWNLERSLKFGDRIHGHLVTGHVDFQGQVKSLKKGPESVELWVSFPKEASKYFWSKGSVCLNGVSLTINEVKEGTLRVNLIPETLRVTNLSSLEEGQSINIEVDSFARGLVHYFSEREPNAASLR